MKTTPHRDKDGGPIINWLADMLNYFGCWLVRKTSRYALMYQVDFDEDDWLDEPVLVPNPAELENK